MTTLLTILIVAFVAACVLLAIAICRDSAARERAQGHCVRGAGIDMAESRRRHEGADKEEYRGA